MVNALGIHKEEASVSRLSGRVPGNGSQGDSLDGSLRQAWGDSLPAFLLYDLGLAQPPVLQFPCLSGGNSPGLTGSGSAGSRGA